jgi:ribose/xylose/arabinose/galactoside ABC-type transport system permease subunit
METVEKRERPWLKLLTANILIVFLVLVCVMFALFQPRFLAPENLLNVLIQVAINAMLSTGMTFVLLTGGIDVSVGSVVALAGVVSTMLAKPLVGLSAGGAIALQLGVTLGIGILCGGITAITVAKLNVAPFIATLAVSSIARGAGYILTDGKTVFDLPVSFQNLGQARIFGNIPVMVIILAVMMILSYIILSKLPIGRHIYAVGSNEEVAYLSGISPVKIKMIVYIVCGCTAAFAGVCMASKFGTGQPAAGAGYELTAIASVVMGGTSLSGGRGGIGRTVIGVLTIGIINNGLNLLQVSSYWQQIAMGAIIMAAVILDQNTKK